MRVLLLPDDLYDYLVHVVRNHSNSGIEPEEGQLIFQLNNHVKSAQNVDVSQLVKAGLTADQRDPADGSIDGPGEEVPGLPPSGSV